MIHYDELNNTIGLVTSKGFYFIGAGWFVIPKVSLAIEMNRLSWVQGDKERLHVGKYIDIDLLFFTISIGISTLSRITKEEAVEYGYTKSKPGTLNYKEYLNEQG